MQRNSKRKTGGFLTEVRKCIVEIKAEEKFNNLQEKKDKNTKQNMANSDGI